MVHSRAKAATRVGSNLMAASEGVEGGRESMVGGQKQERAEGCWVKGGVMARMYRRALG
jgi:hypothetical protein